MGRVTVGESGVIGFKRDAHDCRVSANCRPRGILCGGGESRVGSQNCISTDAVGLGPCPCLSGYPDRLTGSLIFFSSSLFPTFPSLFLHDRNAHDFLSFSSSPSLPPSRVDLTVDHAHLVSDPFCFLPATPRSATSTLDVNPLLFMNSNSSLSLLFISFFETTT